VKAFEHRGTKRLRLLRGRIKKWVAANTNDLRTAKPEVPDGLHNRSADNWRPLLAIAAVAGGKWPKRARSAAESLSVSMEPPQSQGVMLLSDIREVFAAGSADRVFSSDLAAALAGLEGRPWCERNGRGPINANAVAIVLAPYGIKPRDIRKKSVVRKGYGVGQFTDAFARYLPKA
jgi:hypothetical protein